MRINLLLILLAISSVVYTPEAHAQGALAKGLLGDGMLSLGGFGLYGERLDGGGGGGGVFFEMAATDVKTALGAYMGVEILMYLGYESFEGEDPHGGEMTLGPLLFDIQLGFPVTFLTLGSGGFGSTAFTAGPGVGLSVQHTYAYLRARTLTRLSKTTFVELRGRWIPSVASYDWSARTGLGVYDARVSLTMEIFEDTPMLFFAGWSTADRARDDEEDPMHPALTPATNITAFESGWHGGVGFLF